MAEGFDAALDHRDPDFPEALRAAVPDGIDIYFENVGGAVAAAGWVAEGKVRYREDIVEGLAQAPEAFIGMLEGRNFGKLVVRVG